MLAKFFGLVLACLATLAALFFIVCLYVANLPEGDDE